jgi:hypothetical protein
MNGKQLKETLAKVEAGKLYDIFNLLPEVAGGRVWVEAIKETARDMKDYLDDSIEYDIDDLRDLSMSYAEREVETYHRLINEKVQALQLWASDDLDDDVRELNQGAEYPTITQLNMQYLYCASVQLFGAVADQVFQHTEESEAVSA